MWRVINSVKLASVTGCCLIVSKSVILKLSISFVVIRALNRGHANDQLLPTYITGNDAHMQKSASIFVYLLKMAMFPLEKDIQRYPVKAMF